MGYAYSALLAPLPVANSRVPKPWRKAGRGRSGVRAQHSETSDARRRMRRAAITIPGRKWTSVAESVPRAEFPVVNPHLVLFAAGRERTRAYSILVLISGLNGRQACDQWARLHGGGEEKICLLPLEFPGLAEARGLC